MEHGDGIIHGRQFALAACAEGFEGTVERFGTGPAAMMVPGQVALAGLTDVAMGLAAAMAKEAEKHD